MIPLILSEHPQDPALPGIHPHYLHIEGLFHVVRGEHFAYF